MGLAAKSEVQVVFKKEIPTEFKEADALMKALKTFHGEPCSVNVFQLEVFSNAVYFELYSDRYQNTYWQQDLLVKYLKENYINEVQLIDTSVWTADDNDLYLEPEDLEDYA